MKFFPNYFLIATAVFLVAGSMPMVIQAEETSAPAATPSATKKEKKDKPEKAAKPEKAEKAEKKPESRVRGKVSEVNATGKSLMLDGKGKGAGATVVNWTESTKFKKGKADATAADLAVGGTLMVVLAEDGTAKMIIINSAKEVSKEKKPKKNKAETAPKTAE